MIKSITFIFSSIILCSLIFFAPGTAFSRISAGRAYTYGIDAYEAGDYRTALDKWHSAIWYAIKEKQKEGWPMRPEDYQIGSLAYFYRGLTYLRLEKEGLAIAEFRNAEHWSDGFSDIQLNIASQYFDLERFDETIRVCRNVIKNDPKNGQAHYLMGYSYYKKNDLVAARESALAAREYGYPFSDFLVEKLEGNKKKTPVEALEKGRDELSSTYLPLAAKYYEQGKYEETIEICQKILQAEPENGMSHYYLGHAYYASRQYEKALQHANLAKEYGVSYADLLIQKLEGKNSD